MNRPIWRVAALLAFCLPACYLITQTATLGDSGRSRPRPALTAATFQTLEKLNEHRKQANRDQQALLKQFEALVKIAPNALDTEIAAADLARKTALLDAIDVRIKAVATGKR